MNKIAILGHWHTGSSLISQQLNACGMEVGNENTYWTEDCVAQCEHSYLNQIGDQLLLGNITKDHAANEIAKVLRSYLIEGEANNWGVVGVKVTHVLQNGAFDVFLKAFDNIWGDVFYIITTRNPIAIFASTKNPKWDYVRVMESIDSTHKSIGYLFQYKNTILLKYPIAWYNDALQWVVEQVGLKWNKKAAKMFNSNRVNNEYDWKGLS